MIVKLNIRRPITLLGFGFIHCDNKTVGKKTPKEEPW
jgi:hypothetical protein